MPSLPSITEVEKPAVLSSTCAWKIEPSISDPLVPGATHGLAVPAAGLAGVAFWAVAMPASAINEVAARKRVRERFTSELL